MVNKTLNKKVFLVVTGIILLLLAGGCFAYFLQKPQHEKILPISSQEESTFSIYLVDNISDPMFAHTNNELRVLPPLFAKQELKDMLDNPELSQYFAKKGKLINISPDQDVSSTEKMLLDLAAFRNDYLGISFNYPRYYLDTRCDVSFEQTDTGDYVKIGSRIDASITPYAESTLNLNDLVSSTLNDVQVTTHKNIVVGGKKALQIGYRFGGMGRYGEITYVVHKKKLYTFGFTAGVFECGFEPMVYDKILETLQFDF